MANQPHNHYNYTVPLDKYNNIILKEILHLKKHYIRNMCMPWNNKTKRWRYNDTIKWYEKACKSN